MADPVGALHVILGADTAALEKGLKNSQSAVQAFASSFKKAIAGLTLGAIGAKFAYDVNKMIDVADHLGKSAQKIGIPVEELSALRHAADLSGVSMEGLEKGVSRLSKAMVEAAAKPTSEAANAFKALGVSATDSNGKLKTSSAVMADIAGKFEGLKDGAGKTAVSMALFGRAGADLIPLLNSGKAGLNGMVEEARQLGIVISTETAKSAERFNDNLTRLGKVKDAIILKITEGMLPSLEKLSQRMVDAAKDGDTLKAWGETIGNVFVSLINIIERVGVAWQRLGVEWQALREFMQTDIFSGKILENWQKFNETGAQTKRILEDLSVAQSGGFNATFDGVATKAPAATKALQDFNYAALNSAENEKKALALAKTIDQEAESIFQRYKTPAQELQEEIEKINSAFARGIISQELYGQASDVISRRVRDNWANSVSSGVSGFQQLAQAFGKNSKTMATAAKAFGIIEATINTYTAFTKALNTGLPPYNYIAAAGVLAAGLAKVAAIKSQSIPSFATGGAIRLPNQFGGQDSQLLQARISPDEQIDIWRPGEGPDPRRGGDAPQEVIIRGDGWLRPFAEMLIPQINSAIKDGYELKFAPA